MKWPHLPQLRFRALFLGNFVQDVRYAARTLRKSPIFMVVGVVSLALGIGAGTAIFSLVNAILLRSLPVPNPHELRVLNWSGADFHIGYDGNIEDDGPGRKKGNAFSYEVFRALREPCAAQADIFGYTSMEDVTARARHEAVGAAGLMVSDNFFSGLGVHPLLGRLLGPEDERPGAAPSVVISYRWWDRQFDLDPGALGQPVILNGRSATVVGVLPREFPGINPGAETELYVPLSGVDPRRWRMPLMARMRAGASQTRFQAALDVVLARAAAAVMKEPKVLLTNGRAGPDLDRRQYRGPLSLLLGVVGVVMLVACANLAGLSLARGAARQHEFAVRAALGAVRGRLIRQSLTESLLMALVGGGLGAIALWGKTAISRLLLGSTEGLHYDTSLDLRVLGFTLAISLLTRRACSPCSADRSRRWRCCSRASDSTA
jgi:predicted permease